MNNSSLNVNVRTTDPKIIKKLRKAVEKILEQEKTANESLSYSIDSSYSNGRPNMYVGGRRSYQAVTSDEG